MGPTDLTGIPICRLTWLGAFGFKRRRFHARWITDAARRVPLTSKFLNRRFKFETIVRRPLRAAYLSAALPAVLAKPIVAEK